MEEFIIIDFMDLEKIKKINEIRDKYQSGDISLQEVKELIEELLEENKSSISKSLENLISNLKEK